MGNTPYLTPQLLSERLDIPVGTLYHWAHQGKGPARHKFGKHSRYLIDDVIEWEASRRTEPDA